MRTIALLLTASALCSCSAEEKRPSTIPTATPHVAGVIPPPSTISSCALATLEGAWLRERRAPASEHPFQEAIDLVSNADCHDCYHSTPLNMPAFFGSDSVQQVWTPLLIHLQRVLGRSPFLLAITSQESDELCLESHRSKSTVLGAPYFEDLLLCARALPYTAQVCSGLLSGVRLRFSVSLMLSKNPASVYREPDAVEAAAYLKAFETAYFDVIRGTCRDLGGALIGRLCRVR